MAMLLDFRVYKVAFDSLIIMGVETSDSAKQLLHSLYLSNIDTNMYERNQTLDELDQSGFMRKLSETKGVRRPDEIRLYQLLNKINRNIQPAYITEKQRNHVKRLRAIIRKMETSYYRRFGHEIYERSRPTVTYGMKVDSRSRPP